MTFSFGPKATVAPPEKVTEVIDTDGRATQGLAFIASTEVACISLIASHRVHTKLDQHSKAISTSGERRAPECPPKRQATELCDERHPHHLERRERLEDASICADGVRATCGPRQRLVSGQRTMPSSAGEPASGGARQWQHCNASCRLLVRAWRTAFRLDRSSAMSLSRTAPGRNRKLTRPSRLAASGRSATNCQVDRRRHRCWC